MGELFRSSVRYAAFTRPAIFNLCVSVKSVVHRDGTRKGADQVYPPKAAPKATRGPALPDRTVTVRPRREADENEKENDQEAAFVPAV